MTDDEKAQLEKEGWVLTIDGPADKAKRLSAPMTLRYIEKIDRDDDFFYLIGVLDRILVEAKTLDHAKTWAAEAVRAFEQRN